MGHSRRSFLKKENQCHKGVEVKAKYIFFCTCKGDKLYMIMAIPSFESRLLYSLWLDTWVSSSQSYSSDSKKTIIRRSHKQGLKSIHQNNKSAPHWIWESTCKYFTLVILHFHMIYEEMFYCKQCIIMYVLCPEEENHSFFSVLCALKTRLTHRSVLFSNRSSFTVIVKLERNIRKLVSQIC